jgi:Fic family protein
MHLHPFLDGNGHLGRLLLVFFLVARGRIDAPLLYLSAYVERHRQAYYDSLQAIRQSGDPVPWIEPLLTAVQTEAADAVPARSADHRSTRAVPPGRRGDDGRDHGDAEAT